ncbi:MAG: PD40 domain-containing protein [Planctomycetes bacterium]|nr:PD40 domain-containing protein [Planctomycetota bacterium]
MFAFHPFVSARFGTSCSAAFALALASAPAFAQGGIDRVSVSTSGLQANALSNPGGVSADGRYVVFDSAATNLVLGDANGHRDVFLRDRVTGTTTRVSVGLGGVEADGQSFGARISGDGNRIVFTSNASNLVAGDIESPSSPASSDCYLFDRAAGVMQRLSVTTSGAEITGQTAGIDISADGTTVVFAFGGDLTTGAPSLGNAYALDLATQAVERLDVTSSGADLGTGCIAPRVSADGRFVTFVVVLPPQPPVIQRIAVRDRLLGITTIASVSDAGVLADDDCAWPTISDDGRVVAFASIATNLLATPVFFGECAYYHDLSTGTTHAVNVDASGLPLPGSRPVVSPDGRRIAFITANSRAPILDLTTGVVVPAATTARGELANTIAQVLAFSADGRFGLIASGASNLVANDTNAITDVFVKTVLPRSATSYCTPRVNSQGCTPVLAASGVAAASGGNAFVLTATNLINRSSATLFWSLVQSTDPFAGGTMCVAAPLRRAFTASSGGSATGVDCTGSLSFDFNPLIRAGSSPVLIPGSVVYAQVTFVDAGDPSGIGLTDAIAFRILP